MGPTVDATNAVPSESAWLTDATGGRIPIGAACSLGRGPSNHLSIPDERVSRHHALIEIRGNGEYWLVDLGSRNGTYLNGRRIGHPAPLRDGDALGVGPFTFVFHAVRPLGQPVEGDPPSDETVVEFRPAECWLLVADIIGSTRFARELAPEELGRLTGKWLADCKAIVEESGGLINQFLGDCLFAYWHDREAVEPDLERALRGLGGLQDRAQPAFRVALHHGRVTLGGAALGEEERISGLAVHFAFRMERLGARLGLPRLLSEPAAERFRSLLTPRALGRHAIPGFEGDFAFYAF